MTGHFLFILLFGLLVYNCTYPEDKTHPSFCSGSAFSILCPASVKKRSFPLISKPQNVQNSTYLSLILILSGDIQLNPGPRTPKYPCGLCHKACKWTTPCVRCDTCKVYYHQDCMHMPSEIFNNLKNISWECFHCGVPNFSSSFFNSTLESSISNRFDILSPENTSGHSFSFGSPAATSSPTQVRRPKKNSKPQ